MALECVVTLHCMATSHIEVQVYNGEADRLMATFHFVVTLHFVV